ncbi:MFS transporter [Pseudomonas sp. HMWF032]|uniref:acyl-CoA thioesterase n=1 Tax=unclassified Pseudomonas TaxID=196821 RepID=UPI000D3A8824|nr:MULTISPECIES: thioesterase family protein [unclassified Pseudomonas]PTS86053.1 MFS transporter [Pseudomonas sp. HMWF032]PTT82248.1 MFS transporter [Pseudomonas sp. HMWF010]WAC46357.1 thioesterase family protein [Pseudomonas sp. SL4(2022)]
MSHPPSRDACSFFHPLRVRWAEVDPQSIVFNGHYLTYADVAITEYFRALGIRYPDDLRHDGGDFFAIKTVLEYLAPARFDDQLQIGIRVARLGRSSLSFVMGIWRDEQALTAGEVIYVYADSANRNSRPLPDWLKQKILAFERSAPQQ